MREFTKKHLVSQFIAYCNIVPLKDISIKGFVEFAGISKQTFYNYFKDKSDLMNYAFEAASQSIVVDMDASLQGIFYGASEMARVCRAHRNFYMQMAKYETQNSFELYFLENVEGVYRRTLAQLGYFTETDSRKQQVVHYFCRGICAFFIDWIRSGMKESPESVARTIIACMPTEIKEILTSAGDAQSE